jgi:hypothetical protein
MKDKEELLEATSTRKPIRGPKTGSYEKYGENNVFHKFNQINIKIIFHQMSCPRLPHKRINAVN